MNTSIPALSYQYDNVGQFRAIMQSLGYSCEYNNGYLKFSMNDEVHKISMDAIRAGINDDNSSEQLKLSSKEQLAQYFDRDMAQHNFDVYKDSILSEHNIDLIKWENIKEGTRNNDFQSKDGFTIIDHSKKVCYTGKSFYDYSYSMNYSLDGSGSIQQKDNSISPSSDAIRLNRNSKNKNGVEYDELYIPQRIFGHNLTPDEQRLLKSGSKITVNKNKNNEISIQVNKDNNSIQFHSNKPLGTILEIGGYKFSDLDLTLMSAGSYTPPVLLQDAKSKTFFLAELLIDSNSISYKNIQALSKDQVKEYQHKITTTMEKSIENLSKESKVLIKRTDGTVLTSGESLSDAIKNSNGNLQNADLQKMDLSNLNFEQFDMTGANLSQTLFKNSNLSRVKFHNAILHETCFIDAKIHESYFTNAQLSNVDFHNADLTECNLSNLNLEGTNMTNANLSMAMFDNSNLSKVNFSGAYMYETTFENAKIQNADFTNARFIDVNFQNADFTGSNFTKVKIRGKEIFDMNEKIAEGRNYYAANLKNGNFTNVNFTQANFDGAFSKDGIFENATFKDAILKSVNIEQIPLLQELQDRSNLHSIIKNGFESFVLDFEGSADYTKNFLNRYDLTDLYNQHHSAQIELSSLRVSETSTKSAESELFQKCSELDKDLIDKAKEVLNTLELSLGERTIEEVNDLKEFRNITRLGDDRMEELISKYRTSPDITEQQIQSIFDNNFKMEALAESDVIDRLLNTDYAKNNNITNSIENVTQENVKPLHLLVAQTRLVEISNSLALEYEVNKEIIHGAPAITGYHDEYGGLGQNAKETELNKNQESISKLEKQEVLYSNFISQHKDLSLVERAKEELIINGTQPDPNSRNLSDAPFSTEPQVQLSVQDEKVLEAIKKDDFASVLSLKKDGYIPSKTFVEELNKMGLSDDKKVGVKRLLGIEDNLTKKSNVQIHEEKEDNKTKHNVKDKLLQATNGLFQGM